MEYLQQVAFITQILWQVFFLFVYRICPSKNKYFPLFFNWRPVYTLLVTLNHYRFKRNKSSFLMRILPSSQNFNIKNVFYRNSVSIVASPFKYNDLWKTFSVCIFIEAFTVRADDWAEWFWTIGYCHGGMSMHCKSERYFNELKYE